MNNDIGFFICKLTNNPEHNKILNTINHFIENNPYQQYLVFNSFCENINTHNIPMLHLSHAKFFYGNLFVFDFISLILASKFPNIKNIYYYANNIPWNESMRSKYTDWEQIFDMDHLKIITTNQPLYDIYNIVWKKPAGISENFSYEELANIL